MNRINLNNMKSFVKFFAIALVLAVSCEKPEGGNGGEEPVPVGDVPEVTSNYHVIPYAHSLHLSLAWKSEEPISEIGAFYSTEESDLDGDYANAQKVSTTDFINGELLEFDITGLEPDTQYFFRGFAVNKFGMGVAYLTYFTTDKALVPKFVEKVEAKDYCSTAITLKWSSDTKITGAGFYYSKNASDLSGDMSGASVAETFIGANSVKVTIHGGLEPGTTYYYSSYAENEEGKGWKKMSTFETLPIPNAVDFGLPSGTKWAELNLGAAKSTDGGFYYAWGETDYKSRFGWGVYLWCEAKSSTSHLMTKYNVDSNCGVVDNKTVLDAEDDAASKVLGSAWHIPTEAEWQELLNNTKYTWKDKYSNGKIIASGYELSKGATTIFFPAIGYRDERETKNGERTYYWSSSLHTSFPKEARASANGVMMPMSRYCGLPIRAVCK